MRVIKNESVIKRNGRIGQWTSLGALAVLGIGMYLSFQRPDLFAYSIGALILGFTMTQVGMYLSNRFGRSPRPDEKLDAGLKGLPGDTTIYHYVAPAQHLLVGPMGVWVLLPFHQRGTVTFERNRWRVRGGGFMQTYMTIFGQEGLGRPEADAEAQIQATRRYFVKHMDESLVPTVRAALVFTNDAAEVLANDAPLPAIHVKKLKDFIRQKIKDDSIGSDTLLRVRACLPQD